MSAHKLTIDEVLKRGVEQILPTKDGLKALMQKKKITLYQGFDPSMPSLHLGNLVGMMKLRQFQKLGHKVIFLIGDFTGMIGDPTDKISARKKLTLKEVQNNANNWEQVISKILDTRGPHSIKILQNSAWNNSLSFEEIIEISSKFTVQQLIERDMFQNRIKNNKPIYVHEFLYPVVQGYDSVHMNVDLEVGGSDQIFNMLSGRTLLKSLKGKEKYILGTKLLVDKEGNKAGKTTGNALFLDSKPEDFYVGIMSFTDELILLGFELLTELPLAGVDEKIKHDPMTQKKTLAFEVTKTVHGDSNAKKAQEYFEKTFQKKAPTYNQKVKLKDNLVNTISQVVSSKSEAKRLISQGAVDVNEKTSTNPIMKIKLKDKIKVGAHTFLIVV
jgi:tyrosyl-tRNA synthetase